MAPVGDLISNYHDFVLSPVLLSQQPKSSVVEGQPGAGRWTHREIGWPRSVTAMDRLDFAFVDTSGDRKALHASNVYVYYFSFLVLDLIS